VDDGNNKPQIKVQFKGEDKTYYPEEISAMFLTKMKLAYFMFDIPINKKEK
jgi:L1 cell adhesion molecule like protein